MHRTNDKGQFIAIPLAERFWDKVDKNGPIHPYDPSLGPCWIWIGRRATTKQGRNYGRIKDGKRQLSAHRIAWELTKGRKIPRGKGLLHSCDNPPCVNPSHTNPGTDADNHADMISRGRSRKGEQHPHAKVTEDLAREIKANFPLKKKRGTGTPPERAARRAFFKKYKVSYYLAYRIASGKSWKHLTD